MPKTTVKDTQRQKKFLEKFEAYKNGATKLAFGDEGDPLKPKFSEFARQNATAPFPKYLRNLIDGKGVTDVTVYTRACITKNLFYRILSTDKSYHTSKDKVAALALALRLNLREAEELYLAAGYNLTKSEVPDLIIRFCLESKMYRVDDVNYCLTYYGFTPLGSGFKDKPKSKDGDKDDDF